MNKGVSLILVGVVLVGSILACTWTITGSQGNQVVLGSGKLGEENRTVSNFNAVELGAPGTLDITIGSSESLRIEADDNLLQYIQTDISGGRLVIKTQTGITLQPVQPIKYHLSVIRLNSVGISSSGDISVPDLKSDNFSISLSSSGNLSMQSLDCSALHMDISSSGDASISSLNAKTLSVNISSSGKVDIGAGSVTRQTIKISSSGDFNARDLASEQADVTLSSSGDATLRVSKTLSGNLSSSGNINYVGNPKVNVHSSSSGSSKQIK